MLDKILRVMATMDVVGGVKAIATKGDVVHVPRGQGISGNEVKRLLKRNGVKVKDVFVLTTVNRVRLVVDDAERAARILERHGVDVA